MTNINVGDRNNYNMEEEDVYDTDDHLNQRK